MKKSKLITSVCSLGALVAATPIIATSCSSNNENKVKITINKEQVKGGIEDYLEFCLIDSNNRTIKIKRIDNATSSDESTLKVEGLSVFLESTGVVKVKGLKENTAKLNIKIVDVDDFIYISDFTISVSEPEPEPVPTPTMTINGTSNVVWVAETNSLYIANPKMPYSNFSVSYPGSDQTPVYELYDISDPTNPTLVPNNIAQIQVGGAMSITENALPTANSILEWEIRSEGAEPLIVYVLLEFTGEANYQEIIPTISASTPEDTTIGSISVYRNGEPYDESAITYGNYDFVVDPTTCGLNASAFSLARVGETNVYEVKFNAASQTGALAEVENVKITVRWAKYGTADYERYEIHGLKVNIGA